MTNFIYNMQDELFHLNMILPVGEFSPIKKLVDHIEAQGKQLRELNNGIAKKNATIEKYEREKKDLQERNSCLYKKVVELNNGIRNSEDLTWKQKYEALLHSSEQAIGALQKKCQEYKNSESDAITSTIETLVKTNKELERKNERLKENFEKLEHNYNELINQRNVLVDENKKLERSNLDLGDTIGLYVEDFKKLKAENEEIISTKNAHIISLEQKIKNANKEPSEYIQLELVCHKHEETIEHLEKALEDEKQVSKDLNTIINSNKNLLDEYMTKCNNLLDEYMTKCNKLDEYMTKCNKLESELMDYIKENSKLRAKIARIGGMCDGIKKIVKE